MGAVQAKEDGSSRSVFAQIVDPTGIVLEPSSGMTSADEFLREKYMDGTLEAAEPGLDIDREMPNAVAAPTPSPSVSLDVGVVSSSIPEEDAAVDSEECPGLEDPLTGEDLINSAAGIQRVIPKAILPFFEQERRDMTGEELYRANSAPSSATPVQNRSPVLGA